MTPPRFPHSDIRGSRPACGSPRLFAACHVLLRFPAPRHPPSALTSLTTIFFFALSTPSLRRSAWLLSRSSPSSVVKEHREHECARDCWNTLRITHALVEMTGFEPATPCLQSRCSPN